MSGRVIQGFFIGGAMRAPILAARPAAVPRATATAPGGAAPGPPAPAFARHGAPLQARLAPGPPLLAHRPGQPVQRHGDVSFAIDPEQIGLARGDGTPLPRAVLAKMEAAFGADFSAVRVHVGPQASRIGAVAFTTGNDLYFAPGQFQPDSVKGQQLIGHELAHVIQQRQGRVRAPGNGIAVVQDRALEAEADRLGMRAANLIPERNGSAVRLQPKTNLSGHTSGMSPQSRSIQRLTRLDYNVPMQRAGTSVVTGMRHTRSPHSNTHRNIAAYRSGYDDYHAAQADGCNVCNHYMSYSRISRAVANFVFAQPDLDAAVGALMGMNGNLPGSFVQKRKKGVPFGYRINAVPPIAIVPAIAAAMGNPAQYNDNLINTEIDDLINNLANDPRNLFYWPNSSGDNGGATLDVPNGPSNSNITAGALTISLNAYRTTLLGLGLAV